MFKEVRQSGHKRMQAKLEAYQHEDITNPEKAQLILAEISEHSNAMVVTKAKLNTIYDLMKDLNKTLIL